METISYMRGFGNEFSSEACGFDGAIPSESINPQKCKYGLFAEQLSGSAFTAPRCSNKRSWLYRLKPSVGHSQFRPLNAQKAPYLSLRNGLVNPNQTGWFPFHSHLLDQGEDVDFVEGIHTLAFSSSDGCADSSVAIHIYLANADMRQKCLVNSDGDFLIVPQEGTLYVTTEFGKLMVEPNEIVVIQQGMKFSISKEPQCPKIRGYILEVRGNHFELPQLGPIGANGLANPRDFEIPVARLDEPDKITTRYQIILKFQNELFEAEQSRSPFNVAAWFGNYTPYKYNLARFVAVNSVTVDHPDPSIFTVLTCPSIGKPGTALADFVIFPPRWECALGTFRPPYYHRNCMTEFMGLIKGHYQAKPSGDKFMPGGATLHQAMLPHGPDADCFNEASNQDTSSPKWVADGTMAFMFETCYSVKLTEWASSQNVNEDYPKCWDSFA